MPGAGYSLPPPPPPPAPAPPAAPPPHAPTPTHTRARGYHGGESAAPTFPSAYSLTPRKPLPPPVALYFLSRSALRDLRNFRSSPAAHPGAGAAGGARLCYPLRRPRNWNRASDVLIRWRRSEPLPPSTALSRLLSLRGAEAAGGCRRADARARPPDLSACIVLLLPVAVGGMIYERRERVKRFAVYCSRYWSFDLSARTRRCYLVRVD